MTDYLYQLDASAASIQLADSNISNVQSNIFSNYNSITRTVSQLPPLYYTIYYGTGNTNCSNLIVSSNANINGNLFIDNGTLFANTLNNRVGINNVNSQYDLDINGSANISINGFIRNNVAIGSSSASANLDIQGNARISGNLNVGNGALWVDDITNRVGILNTNPQSDFDLKGNVNISGNILVRGTGTIGNVLLNAFQLDYTTINGATTFTLPSSIRKFIFTQRQTITTAVTSTTYNALKLTYSPNITIFIFVKINSHIYYNATTSSGILQTNRILIVSNNTASDTSVTNVSNASTRLTISKGTSNTWTSYNMSTDTTTAGQTIIQFTPIFTGTQDLSASSTIYEWTIYLSNNDSNNLDITTIQTYAGV